MVRKMAEETNCQGIHIVKILFLDMDGVVNKGRDNASPNRYRYNDKWSNPSDRFDLYYVDPELAARVSALVTDFDLRIVSTSTWRCGKTVDEFKELLNNRFLPGDRLICFTGCSESMRNCSSITPGAGNLAPLPISNPTNRKTVLSVPVKCCKTHMNTIKPNWSSGR